MKLYLKHNIPGGIRHYILDTRTLAPKRPGYLLFPTKCEEDIPDEDGKLLMDQNPDQLSVHPLKKIGQKKQEVILEKTGLEQPEIIEDDTPDVPSGLLEEEEYMEEDEIVKILNELSTTDFSKLDKHQVSAYARHLNVKIPVTMKHQKRIEILEARCEELTKRFIDKE